MCMRFLSLILVLLLTHSLSSQQAASDIRAELIAIDIRHAHDLNDYLARCTQVRSLIPRLEAFYRQGDLTITELKKQHPGDTQFLKLADFFQHLNAEDKVGFEILKKEMQVASEMAHVPAAKRQAFFDQNIYPLQKKEDAVSAIEVAMARKALQDRTPLPQDIVKKLQTQ